MKQSHYRFDAIVTLGAAVWPDETPSPTLKHRSQHAADQFQKGLAPIIIASGGLGKFPPSEAQMIKRLCVSEGVPGDQILLEDKSTSTLENVRLTSAILKSLDARTILVVSDKYHLPRAKMCFRHFGFHCEGSGPQRPLRSIGLKLWVSAYMREWLALPYYWVRLKFEGTQ